MREELAQARAIVEEEGIPGIVRSASRVSARRYYGFRNGPKYNSRGTDVFEEDWDNLVILDACRYDYFRRYNDIPGRLESRISRGSMSREFVRGNFENRRLYDTVYFSDNAWFGKIHEEIGADLYDYSLSERDAFDGLVSHPSTLTESALEYDREYPDKRLIVHYLQPHAPYFSRDGEERFRWPSEHHGDCDPEELREAYVGNLELVLSEAERLIDALRGKTVVTADHGELLGERLPPFQLRQYQHPPGIYVEPLVKVPWLVVDEEGRKEITTGTASESSDYGDLDDEEIDQQLRALGYR